MPTVTKKTRKVKTSERSLRIGDAAKGVRPLALTKDGITTGYFLREIPVDFGRGFELTKSDQTEGDDRQYHVHLDGELGDSCTCKGYVYRPDRGCKHLDAVKKLVALSKV